MTTSTTTLGKRAENRVAIYLKKNGWQILSRNFRRIACELDIVALKKGSLLVAEVKYRAFWQEGGDLQQLIGERKKKHLVKGVLSFLSSYEVSYQTISFELFLVSGQKVNTLNRYPIN